MKKYGEFEIIEYIDEDKVKIRCNNCGKEKIILEKSFLKKKNSDCKCLTKKYIFENYKEIDDMELINIRNCNPSTKKVIVDLRCKKCGIIKTVVLNSYIRGLSVRHSYYCNEILLLNLRDKYGKNVIDKFYNMYYNSKTRVCNKNYIETKPTYKDLEFGYEDFYQFVNDYFEDYIDSLKYIKLEDISIDRIDNNIGYIKGNIQFITKFENAGKKLIHQSRSYDVYYNGQIYNDVNNIDKFIREHPELGRMGYDLFTSVKQSKVYDFKILKKHIKSSETNL